MAKQFQSQSGGSPGAMLCVPDLAEWVRRGMGCEVRPDNGRLVWAPCGRERVRQAAGSRVALVTGSVYRPERCPKCDLEYVEVGDVLGINNDLQAVYLELTCRNCSWDDPSVVCISMEQYDRLIEVEDEQRRQMWADCLNLFSPEMLAWIKQFSAALQDGDILPEDF